MFTAEGTVTGLTQRPFTAKTGKSFIAHGIVIDGGPTIEIGLKERHRVGDKVSYQVEMNYKRWEVKGPAAGDPPMPRVVPAGTSGNGMIAQGASARPFPVPGKSGEMAIIRQNSLTNAVNLVNTLYGISGGTSIDDDNKEASERVDLAIKIAYKFASFSSGHYDDIVAKEVIEKVEAEGG